MFWIIIIAIIIFVIYQMNKEKNEDIDTHITSVGGMQTKYKILVAYLTTHPSSRIENQTKDSLIITCPTMIFYIDVIGRELEILLKAKLQIVGDIKKKWKFPDEYPQEKIIEEIENYLTWQLQNIEKMATSNPYQYLKGNDDN